MSAHRQGTREEWLAARVALLEEEKELLRRSDALARRRRELPWVSSAGSDFNRDFGAFTEEEREAGTGFNSGTPKHADELDLRKTELMALSCFALRDVIVYHT